MHMLYFGFLSAFAAYFGLFVSVDCIGIVFVVRLPPGGSLAVVSFTLGLTILFLLGFNTDDSSLILFLGSYGALICMLHSCVTIGFVFLRDLQIQIEFGMLFTLKVVLIVQVVPLCLCHTAFSKS